MSFSANFGLSAKHAACLIAKTMVYALGTPICKETRQAKALPRNNGRTRRLLLGHAGFLFFCSPIDTKVGNRHHRRTIRAGRAHHRRPISQEASRAVTDNDGERPKADSAPPRFCCRVLACLVWSCGSGGTSSRRDSQRALNTSARRRRYRSREYRTRCRILRPSNELKAKQSEAQTSQRVALCRAERVSAPVPRASCLQRVATVDLPYSKPDRQLLMV